MALILTIQHDFIIRGDKCFYGDKLIIWADMQWRTSVKGARFLRFAIVIETLESDFLELKEFRASEGKTEEIQQIKSCYEYIQATLEKGRR